jgi:hypothetical protein
MIFKVFVVVRIHDSGLLNYERASNVIGSYQCFEEPAASIFRADISCRFLANCGIHLQDYIMVYP